jgi:hypothetical protein
LLNPKNDFEDLWFLGLEKCILQIPEIIRIEEMHFANPRKILGK